MTLLRIATWNAGHRSDAWAVLRSLDADIVLAQELPAPPESEAARTAFSPFASTDNRAWGTAIWVCDLPVRALPATTSDTVHPRPGTTAVAQVELPTGGILTAISLHAVDERIHRVDPSTITAGPPNGYAVTTMHRILSDLTGYLEDPQRKGGRGHARNLTVVGGDFNCNLGWDERQSNPSHRLVFDRVAGSGLKPVIPIVAGDTHATIVRPRIPYRQIDYLYASANAEVTAAGITHTRQLEARGDHLPVWAEIAT